MPINFQQIKCDISIAITNAIEHTFELDVFLKERNEEDNENVQPKINEKPKKKISHN